MRAYLASAVAILALAATGSGATAQTQSGTTPKVPSLVSVDLRNVLNDLAVRLNVDRANVPVTAQVPVTVAANVCGVSVNVLSASTGGQASCTAKTGSVQLAQAVQQQMAAGGSVAGAQSGGAAGVSGTTVGSMSGPTGQTATGGAPSTGMGSTTTGQAASNMPSGATGSMTGQTTTGSTAQQMRTPSTSGTTTTGAQARSASTSGQSASATASTPGVSSYAPGHKKKRHHAKSARAYAPGQQTTPAPQNAPGQQQ